MSQPLTVYIASSFRNVHAVKMLTDRLRAIGCIVLDWTSKAPPLPADMPIEERKLKLDADEYGDIFAFCVNACACADLVIYIGPAGQDAACEVGIAWTVGVPVYGLRGKLEAPGLVLSKAVTRWFDDVGDLLRSLYADQPGGRP